MLVAKGIFLNCEIVTIFFTYQLLKSNVDIFRVVDYSFTHEKLTFDQGFQYFLSAII